MKTLIILLLCLFIPCTALANIPPDKLGHFVAGFAISGIVGGEAGFYAGMLAGAGKECTDYTDRQHHSVEFWDFAATTAGAYLAWRLAPHNTKKQPTMTIELYDGSKI